MVNLIFDAIPFPGHETVLLALSVVTGMLVISVAALARAYLGDEILEESETRSPLAAGGLIPFAAPAGETGDRDRRPGTARGGTIVRRRSGDGTEGHVSFRDTDPNPVVEWCTDGTVAYLNGAAERLFPGLDGQGVQHPYLAGLPLLQDTLLREDGRSFTREICVEGLWYRQELHYVAAVSRVRIYGYDVTCRRRMEESLQRSEEKYRMLFETMLQGVLYQDAEGRIVSANRAARAILGISSADIPDGHTGSGRRDAVREDGTSLDDDEHPSMIALREGREVRDMIMGVRARDEDGYRWLSVNAVPQFRPGESRPYQVYTIFDDITERRRAEKKLKDSEVRYRKLFESTRDGILILDAGTGAVIDANPMFLSLFGYSPDELAGKKLADTHLFADMDSGAAVAEAILGREYARYDNLPLKAKNGGIIEAELVSNVCRTDNGTVIQCTVRDIRERQQAERQIMYLSFHDKTTGLYNRTYFEEELKRLDTKRGLPISLIMGDVNNLKLVNDAFGHREGDKLLIRIANILKDSCRNEDIVARWGGDEFIILLPKTDEKTAIEIVKRIRRDCIEAKERPVKPAIALGIATKERMGVDIHEVLKEAEDRMYRNKLTDGKSGRNAVISSLLKTLRERSHETSQHTQRLRRLVLATGNAAGLSDSQLDELALLSVLHDIGKVAIPDEILMKPGPLSAKEWKTMTKHPEVGYRIAQSFSALAHIADAILAHHERWDGTGYPQGLKKNEIPLLSRILSIVDAFDVMTHGRPYERPVSQRHALDELKRNAGSQFDPGLVQIFVETVTSSPAHCLKEAYLSS